MRHTYSNRELAKIDLAEAYRLERQAAKALDASSDRGSFDPLRLAWEKAFDFLTQKLNASNGKRL